MTAITSWSFCFLIIFQPPSSSSPTSPNCLLTKEWRRLWLDVYQLATTYRVTCWAKNVQLVHDFQDGKNKNVEGVETRVPGFGGTETVELLDPR